MLVFSEKFGKELEQITLNEKAKEKIKSQILKAEENSLKKKPLSKVKKLKWTAAVAAMLCICLIGTAFFEKFGSISQNDNKAYNDTAEVQKAESYDSIYNMFLGIYKENNKSGFKDIYSLFSGNKDNEMLAEKDMGTDGTGTNTSDDYSQTNTQVANVDEADVVKTDGKYIYTLNNITKTVNIVKADNGYLEKKSSIPLKNASANEDDENAVILIDYSDIYVTENRLIVMGYCVKKIENRSFDYTISVFYDIKNPENPIYITELQQSGTLISSRVSNGVLYTFSNETYYLKPQKGKAETYVPTTGTNVNMCCIPVDDIYMFEDESNGYLTVSSVNIEAAAYVNIKAVLGGGSAIYANEESLYVVRTKNETENSKSSNITEIIRFGINKGEISAAAKGKVKGSILNQFSMDESNDYFRIVTTVLTGESVKINVGDDGTASGSAYVSDSLEEVTRSTSIYILNRNLEVVGRLENIAPEESVNSVRFIGDYVYFVTFKNVDPLFAADLSNPKEPKILSALKIPGFSNYLHPYSQDLLLGIGYDADEQTGATNTLKLSMFNISDPTDVKEQNKTLVNGYYTTALETHKAVLVSKEKNIIAFACDKGYYIYGYDSEIGFYLRAGLNLMFDTIYNTNIRGLYINNVFYLCQNSGITSYTMTDFSEISKISLE